LHGARHLSPLRALPPGVREGDQVSVFYDPMISKLIVHGKNRKAALTELSRALRSYQVAEHASSVYVYVIEQVLWSPSQQVAGLPTNLTFLNRVATHEAFGKGSVTTAFLEQYGEKIMSEERAGTPPKTVAIAAVALVVQVAPPSPICSGAGGDASLTRGWTTEASCRGQESERCLDADWWQLETVRTGFALFARILARR
jgi:acetyl/propionyl-CoA carboxylase alpha subunit